MRIFNFEVSTKQLIIGGVIIAVIIGGSKYSSYKKEKEIEARNAKYKQTISNQPEATPYVYDYHSELQKSLEEEYGKPKDGFEWSITGDLVALGDEKMTPEDIVWTYVRSLSVLDFSTAQQYSSKSVTTDRYKEYYSDITSELTDYYRDFLRKQYKKALTTLEIEKVTDTAVFADGEEYVTLKLNILDLTNKDFWRKDKKEIFNQMRVYDETESDDTKKDSYVYDYIYKCYENGTIPKRSVDVELVISKENGKGWLVSNDGELADILSYENGTDVAQYIKDSYSTWLQKTELKEQQQELEMQQKQLEKEQNK